MARGKPPGGLKLSAATAADCARRSFPGGALQLLVRPLQTAVAAWLYGLRSDDWRRFGRLRSRDEVHATVDSVRWA